MRLSKKYVDTIKFYFKEIFNDGDIYLFGSRVDDTKKGGDIDLYIDLGVNLTVKELIDLKIAFKLKLYETIGEQKIDIIFNIDDNRLIEKEAKKWGIKL